MIFSGSYARSKNQKDALASPCSRKRHHQNAAPGHAGAPPPTHTPPILRTARDVEEGSNAPTHPHLTHTHTFQPKDSELMTHKHALDIRQVKKKPQKKRRPGRDTELSTSTQTKAIAAPSSDRRRKTSWRTPSLGQAAPVARPSQESNGPANQKGQTIQLNTSIYPAGRREKDC